MGSWLSGSLVTVGFKKNEVMFGIPNLVIKYLQLEDLEPLYYVRLSATPAVSGISKAGRCKKLICVTLTQNAFN